MSTLDPSYAKRVRPMLGKRYESRFWNPAGMFIQPKLDGLRIMYQNGVFMSRDGIAWNSACLSHIRKALAHVPPDVILDGELYHHGFSLQQINSRAAVNRTTPHSEEGCIQLHLFDLVATTPFYQRYGELKSLMSHPLNAHPVYLVDTHYVGSEEEADTYFRNYLNRGYEGLIYRLPNAPYSLPWECTNKENRSTALLKRKETLDFYATILRVNEGTGRFQGTCGSIDCLPANGRVFAVGSGFTESMRDWCWEHRDELVGTRVKVLCRRLSDTFTPLEPRLLELDAYNKL